MRKGVNVISVRPDKALKEMLDGKLQKSDSAVKQEILNVYVSDHEPNHRKAEDFVLIKFNGAINTVTTDFRLFKGFLVVLFYCKANANGTAQQRLIEYVLSQVQHYIHRQSSQKGYFYQVDTTTALTPTTINLTSGYSVTMLNISWHTTDRFNQLYNNI